MRSIQLHPVVLNVGQLKHASPGFLDLRFIELGCDVEIAEMEHTTLRGL